VVDVIDLPSRNRGELARVAMHRLGRRITHDGGVDASLFGLARDVQGGIRERWLERHVARRAAAVVVASPSEIDGHRAFHCVRTGVEDPGEVREPNDKYPVPHFVFPGSFLYPPHQDAAEWFALYVLPPLRELLPACRIVFAGACPDWMRSFGQLHGIEVTGPLDDLGAVLDGRSVVIAPIRAGSGTVIEVIDAWARGVPVVATSRGVEGLEPHDGDDVLVADDPAEFAAQCSMAARYPALRARLAAHGRARYDTEFTWPGIGAGLFAGIASSAGHIKSGKLRALAVTTAKRAAGFPDLPTVAEAGVPGFDAITWHGVVVPARTPPAVIARLNKEFNVLLQTADHSFSALTDAVVSRPARAAAAWRAIVA